MRLQPRVIVAIVAIVAGAAVLVRGLWRAIPTQPPAGGSQATSPSMEGTAPDGAAREHWAYRIEDLELTDPFAQHDFGTSFSAVVRDAAIRAGAAADASAIASEATAYFVEVVGGTAESYARFVVNRGGTTELTSGGVERRETAHRRTEDVLGAFRGQAISLQGIRVRRRVQDQVTIPVSEWGGRTKLTTAPGQYPALEGVVKNTEYGTVIQGDTFEVLVPIGHQYEDGPDAAVVIGLWLTRSRRDGRWRPSAISMYGPKTLVPLITPPL